MIVLKYKLAEGTVTLSYMYEINFKAFPSSSVTTDVDETQFMTERIWQIIKNYS